MKQISKKLVAGIGAGCLVLGGLGGAMIMPSEEVKVTEVVEVPVEVIKEVPVNVSVEVPVDNGNLQLVLDELYDNDGSVEYLLEDLDDDELDQVVGRILFAQDIKALAVAEVEKEGVEELDKEVVGEVLLDEDDIERLRIYDDADEIVLDRVDYEDGDAIVYVEAKFEQDEIDYVAVFEIKIRDGEVDRMSVESVSLKE